MHLNGWKKAAVVAGALGVLVLTSAASCFGPETKADAPEPTGPNIVDGTNTRVIRMPNGFRNVVFSCYGTDGVFVTSRGDDAYPLTSSVAVVPNDPHCVG